MCRTCRLRDVGPDRARWLGHVLSVRLRRWYAVRLDWTGRLRDVKLGGVSRLLSLEPVGMLFWIHVVSLLL